MFALGSTSFGVVAYIDTCDDVEERLCWLLVGHLSCSDGCIDGYGASFMSACVVHGIRSKGLLGSLLVCQESKTVSLER